MKTFIPHLPVAIAWLFAGASMLHLITPRWLRNMYERWEYPRTFPYVAALLDLAAAVLLVSPDFRGFGIVFAEIIVFFSVVAIIVNEQLLYALPAMALMVVMVPAALSIPEPSPSYGQAKTMIVSTR